MYIELLWIIPLVAFTFFIFLVASFAQKKESSVLSQEVARFNNGYHANKKNRKKSEIRLVELETAISDVTESISHHQQVIDNFQKGKGEYDSQVQDLKDKLRELYREYDIVLSENYTLKAKVKKLTEQKYNNFTGNETVSSQSISQRSAKANLKLYEDTRLLNLMSLDDTAEIDLSQIG